jgi:hypothetical protein
MAYEMYRLDFENYRYDRNSWMFERIFSIISGTPPHIFEMTRLSVREIEG